MQPDSWERIGISPGAASACRILRGSLEAFRGIIINVACFVSSYSAFILFGVLVVFPLPMYIFVALLHSQFLRHLLLPIQSMFSNIRNQNQPQQHYISRSAANDLETARQGQSWPLPLRLSAGGRLRKGVGNYERDLKKLEHKTNSDLLEKLFWYQEFGSRSAQGFRFSEGETFGTGLIKLRQTLRQSSRSSSSFLQLWYATLCLR